MIGKLIAHAADRESALARLDRALADTAILGVTTNVAFLRRLLATEEVRTGAIDNGLLGRLELDAPATDESEVVRAAALISLALTAERAGDDPFERADGWRLGGDRAPSWWTLAVDAGEAVEVSVRHGEAEVERLAADAFVIGDGGERRTWAYALEGSTLWLARDGRSWRVRRPSTEEAHEAAVHGSLRAPMPGQVLLVHAATGDKVRAGDAVLVMESMKMELTINSPVDGIVTDVSVEPGDRVGLDQQLAHVEAA
jgi:acetyl-CoA/propionyl-CoA carboxylase, biotin carboxylase, biotin carboxyl carrier protein